MRDWLLSSTAKLLSYGYKPLLKENDMLLKALTLYNKSLLKHFSTTFKDLR